MTQEELQAVKDTGICHGVLLEWQPEDECVTTMNEDGSKNRVFYKWFRAKCKAQECQTIFKKERIEPEVVEPEVVNLDQV